MHYLLLLLLANMLLVQRCHVELVESFWRGAAVQHYGATVDGHVGHGVAARALQPLLKRAQWQFATVLDCQYSFMAVYGDFQSLVEVQDVVVSLMLLLA